MSHFHHTSMTDALRKYFYSRTHFPWILGGIMVVSGIAGYSCMGWLHDKQMEDRKRIYIEAYHNGDQRRDSNLTNNSLAPSALPMIDSLVSSGDRNRVNGGGEHDLVSLARKMTHRVVTSASHATPLDSVESSMMQRQVTKIW
eukprot:CAMPEP_0181140140 /NCGR_PEP_ID=MMETSP1071-20121207/35151_1 /TAXON_ID=35127 /ORGANISM="Thalassiosira sp., Strain NH16" /LENGTH=142 /DNA_ID=CAMNT_0023227083 /DNA_START=271 /DNA_END=699 /DNA_ORIENTATION=+